MKLVIDLLKFLNLLDRSGNISITNVAVTILVSKLAFTQDPSLVDLGGVLMALLTYMHKRQEANRLKTNDARNAAKLLNDVQLRINEIERTHERVTEQANKTDALLQSATIQNTITRKAMF
jgi:hypothetical protein